DALCLVAAAAEQRAEVGERVLAAGQQQQGAFALAQRAPARLQFVARLVGSDETHGKPPPEKGGSFAGGRDTRVKTLGPYLKPSTCGSQVESCGTKVSSTSTTPCAHRKGTSSRTSAVIGTFETLQVTNSSPPTGGVIMPSVRLTMTIMAKCTGSTPSLTATGARIGASTITPGSG